MDLTRREIDRITLAVAPMLANLDSGNKLTQLGRVAIEREGLSFFTAAEREAYREIVLRVIAEANETTHADK